MKSIYQDVEWLQLQEEKENGRAVEYKYEDKIGTVIYPFIKRKAGIIDDINYYDIVTPRGERGIEINLNNSCDVEVLINNFEKSFQNYCKENNIVAEYVRFSPWEDVSQNFKEIYNIKYHGNLYCVDLRDDFFNNEFSASRRRNIKATMKSGLKVEFDFLGNTIDDFIKLYKYTEKKYNVTDYYTLDKNFIENYFKKLKDKSFFINGYYEQELISSCLILLGEDIAHYHFSANNPEFKTLQANTYLLYKSMEYAKEKGKKIFDLGGATPNSLLEQYKMKFIEKEKEKCIFPYNIGTKIRNHEIYNKLVQKAGGPREGYFPEYRR